TSFHRCKLEVDQQHSYFSTNSYLLKLSYSLLPLQPIKARISNQISMHKPSTLLIKTDPKSSISHFLHHTRFQFDPH
ncbi:hypothetical protein TorRG33x02_058800, partial [Trema orientale]